MKFRGDRFGGIVHDLQMYRRGEAVFIPRDNVRAIQREKLLHIINVLLTLVEDIDQAEMDSAVIRCQHRSVSRYLLASPFTGSVEWCHNCGSLSRKAGEWEAPERPHLSTPNPRIDADEIAANQLEFQRQLSALDSRARYCYCCGKPLDRIGPRDCMVCRDWVVK